VWQSQAAGKYTLELNNKPVASGTLVNLQALTDAAFDYAKKAFELGLGLVSTMVLFLGLMKVGEDAGLVQFVARLMRPIIRRLFPDVPPEHPAVGAIIMNFTTGILGLGNAATPFGLKAMTELQSLNKYKHVASDAMVVLLAWNTAGFAIIPTSMLAVRKAAGCANVLEIIGPCMVAGLASTITGLVCAKLLARLPMFTVEAALAEDGEMPQTAQSSAEDAQQGNDGKDSPSAAGGSTNETTENSSSQKGA
jgi:spore maturation protein A